MPSLSLLVYATVVAIASDVYVSGSDGPFMSSHSIPSQFLFNCTGKSTGLHPDVARNCHVFYLCTKSSQKFTMSCDYGMVFDSHESECVDESLATTCGSGRTRQLSQSDSTETPETVDQILTSTSIPSSASNVASATTSSNATSATTTASQKTTPTTTVDMLYH